MDKIAVLIPCYNEALTVQKVVTDFRRALPEAVIYVYDNNSTDSTAELAAAAGAVVRHEYQQGKGNVIRRMFREVDATAYILVDGDDTYPAEAAPRMVRAVTEHQADMVVGDRLSSTYYTQNKRPFHNFGNDLVRFCTNRLFGGRIKDIMTGYRAFSYRFVKTYPVLRHGFESEPEVTIHALHRNMQGESVVIGCGPSGFSASWPQCWRPSALCFLCRCWGNTSPPALCRASPRSSSAPVGWWRRCSCLSPG